jgi:uncharacterized protein YeaO (DUF488 family)
LAHLLDGITSMKQVIKIKRIYDEATPADGYRVLVDRVWPRGMKKESAAIDEWAKDIAPSTELRKWFNHDPERWAEFQKKYKAELKKNPALESFTASLKGKKTVTLIYSAKDEEHNQAVVLQHYLSGA